MEVRIAGPRIAVGECGRDEATGLDLAGTAGSFAGEDRMRLQERQRILEAESWACWILLATPGGAIAHNVETDFAELKVRSNPATCERALRRRQDSRGSGTGRRIGKAVRTRGGNAVATGSHGWALEVEGSHPGRHRPRSPHGHQAPPPVTLSERLMDRMDGAGGIANENIPLHARAARSVVNSLNSTAELIVEFPAPLGIDSTSEVLSATPWREALRDPEQLKTAGVEAGQKAVVGGTAVAVVVGAGAKFVAKKK